MVQWVQVTDTKADDLGSWKERANSLKVSSDIHIRGMVQACGKACDHSEGH